MYCKAKFSASLLQSSVSYDPSEIILICGFDAQETNLILITNSKNSLIDESLMLMMVKMFGYNRCCGGMTLHIRQGSLRGSLDCLTQAVDVEQLHKFFNKLQDPIYLAECLQAKGKAGSREMVGFLLANGQEKRHGNICSTSSVNI